MTEESDVAMSPMLGRVLAPEGSNLVFAEWLGPPGDPDAPRYEAPLHLHREDDEGWYVLQGRLRVRVGDRDFDVPAGAGVIGPAGRPHTFWNPDSEPVRYLLAMTARTKALLDELHDSDPRPDREAMRELFDAYDCDLLE